MYEAYARFKGTSDNFRHCTNFGQRFYCSERGLLEFMIEIAEKRYPNLEFKIIKVS